MNNIKNRVKEFKILVVVPTYNNAKTLYDVVDQLKQYCEDILVVNDGATDNTSEIIESLSVQSISYMPNKGKGYALRQAIKYATRMDYDYILTIDSDGQHYPSEIGKFIEQIESKPDSLIIGARNLMADNMPSKNTFANKFSNFWYRIETGNKLEDTQSGYRLYPIRKIGNMRFVSKRYEFEVEVIVRAAWRGVEVYNIPIQVYYPPQNERVSHFKPVKDFIRISLLNSVLVLFAFLVFYPWRFIQSLTKENIKQFIKSNITETKESNTKIAASVALGIFFGIVPIWGYQMLIAGITAHFLKLNKVLAIISSNISIPPMIPFILYGSFYVGGILLGADTQLSFSSIEFTDVYKNLFQYLYGAVVFAIMSSILAYVLTLISLLIFRNRTNG